MVGRSRMRMRGAMARRVWRDKERHLVRQDSISYIFGFINAHNHILMFFEFHVIKLEAG